MFSDLNYIAQYFTLLYIILFLIKPYMNSISYY